jgi:competence protein ComEA
MDLDKIKSISIKPNYILNGVLIVVVVALSLFYFRDYFKSGVVEKEKNLSEPQPEVDKVKSYVKKYAVDIDGAVINPGLYELEENKRIYDVIVLAGGFREDVDAGEVSLKINKAEKIKDGMKILIPIKGQNIPTSAAPSSTAPADPEIININESSKDILEKLPKIGPTTADKIIQNRPYENIKDLLDKKILGESTFNSIKDLISV